MRPSVYLSAVILLASTSAATAKHIPAIEIAGHLYELCQEKDDGSKAVCTGFIGGAYEVASNNSVDGVVSCLPHMINVATIQELTLKWIKAHPEEDLQPGSRSVAEAMADAYPCNKPQ
jgi:hypothetical protein